MIPLRHIGQASLRLTNKSPHAAQVHKWWHGAKMHPRWRSIQITHSASKAEAFFTVASSWIGAKFPAGWAKLGSEWLALELTYRFFLNNSARLFLRSSRCSSFKIRGSFPDLKKAVLPHRSSKLRPEIDKSASNTKAFSMHEDRRRLHFSTVTMDVSEHLVSSTSGMQ